MFGLRFQRLRLEKILRLRVYIVAKVCKNACFKFFNV